MTDLDSPILTSSGSLQLHILEYLYDSPDRSTSSETSIRPLEERFDRADVQQAVDDLVKAGLVLSFASLAGRSGAIITTPGLDAVERIRRHRDSRPARNRALRKAILDWLYEQGMDASPVLTGFLGSEHNQFYGAPFGESELKEASQRLRDEGHITGAGSFQGGILRTRITTEGARIVENDGVSDAASVEPARLNTSTPNIRAAARFNPRLYADGGLGGQEVGSATSDRATTKDLIGIGGEVNRLARVLCADATSVPLAVAILADWGSGKSSFMQMLHDRVDRLAAWQQTNAPVNGDPATYVARVRQVRFNAWHYSDDYVLVGMVDKIFQELAVQKVIDPFSNPAEIARLRKARDAAVLDLEHAEKVQKAARQGLRLSLWSVATSGRRGWTGVVSLFVLAFAAFVAWQGEWIFGWLPERAAEATRWLVATGTAVVGAIKIVHSGRAAFREWNASAVEEGAAILEPKVAALREKRDEAERAYLGADATARLADFLERQRDGSQYDAYRGAVGLVYQNLEVLADKIAEDAKQRLQNSAGSDTADSIDRIVLYVDDLDRCAPERVVEVLHAVNLLQVLPLFVAVVSVDAQWLRRSLEFHDRAMFEGVPSAAGAHVGDPLDYLDKIFQIPYSLPPMGRRGAADLVRALVGGQMGESVDDAVHQQKGSTPDLPTNDPGLEVTVDESVSDQEPGIAGRDMRLAETEQDLLAEVAAIVRTPRGVKKLVNLYRLVRVGPQALADPKFADPEGGSGSAVALLLAAVVAMPEAATRLLTALATAPTQDQLLEALEEAIAGHREDNDGDHDDAERCGLCDDLDRLRAEVASLVSRGLVSNDAAAYRDWVNEVARYSFHSARLRDRLADAWADAGRQEG